MDDKFKLLATARTKDELRERINNPGNYMPDTVEASLAELRSRGEIFSEQELQAITTDLDARRNKAATLPPSRGVVNPAEKILQVKDPDAPSFYPKGAIYGFSILFSVLFGSVLLAININQTQKSYRGIWVVLYGLVFSIIQVIIVSSIHDSSVGTLALICGIIGSYPLNYFFWPRYLGKTTLYRRRPVWIPLIIGLVICVPIMYLIIVGGK